MTACGGGAEPGTPPVAPPNPNLQFNLRAHAVWLSTGDNRNYTLTGTCQGVVNITVDVAAPTTFEGRYWMGLYRNVHQQFHDA